MNKKENKSKMGEAENFVNDLKALDQKSVLYKINLVEDAELLKLAIEECQELQMRTGVKNRFSPERKMVDFMIPNLEKRVKMLNNSTSQKSEATTRATVTKLDADLNRLGDFKTEKSNPNAKLNSQAEDFVHELQKLGEKSISEKINKVDDVNLLKKAIGVCAISLSELGPKGKFTSEGKVVGLINKCLQERMKNIGDSNVSSKERGF